MWRGGEFRTRRGGKVCGVEKVMFGERVVSILILFLSRFRSTSLHNISKRPETRALSCLLLAIPGGRNLFCSTLAQLTMPALCSCSCSPLKGWERCQKIFF